MATCWTCSLPERAALEGGRDTGYTLTEMALWLHIDCGYGEPVSRLASRLSCHFNRGQRHGWRSGTA